MAPWPIAMPSSTAIVLNSVATTPACSTAPATSAPRSRRCTCPGTNWVKLFATVMMGLPKSASVIPVARHRARVPGRPARLRLAFEIDAAYALTTGLMLAGVLLLPGVAATVRARLRRLLDGFILAACLFYTAWTLALQPLHEAYLGRPTPVKLSA